MAWPPERTSRHVDALPAELDGEEHVGRPLWAPPNPLLGVGAGVRDSHDLTVGRHWGRPWARARQKERQVSVRPAMHGHSLAQGGPWR